MTLQDIKKDLKEGKSKLIYYSANTLWWTHLVEDVREASKIGREYQRKLMQQKLDDPDFPIVDKGKIRGLLATLDKLHEEQKQHMIKLGVKEEDFIGTPLDPTGSPLMQTDKPEKWIFAAEAKPEHFGKHKLRAFVKSHHKNCEGMCFNNWDRYNDLIELG